MSDDTFSFHLPFTSQTLMACFIKKTKHPKTYIFKNSYLTAHYDLIHNKEHTFVLNILLQ